MNGYFIDTEKLNNAGSDVITLCDEVVNILKELDKRITDMPNITKEWQGTSAVRFSNIIHGQLNDDVALINKVRNMAEELKNEANSYDGLVTGCKIR